MKSPTITKSQNFCGEKKRKRKRKRKRSNFGLKVRVSVAQAMPFKIFTKKERKRLKGTWNPLL